jgi:histidine triad (HIT) family protein
MGTAGRPGLAVSEERCPFCLIVDLPAAAVDFIDWGDVVSFRPRDPVTDGHTLFVPKKHVRDAVEDFRLTGRVFAQAAVYARDCEANLITSVGPAATQTVFHLHVHVVPRRAGDGLALPWTGPTP